MRTLLVVATAVLALTGPAWAQTPGATAEARRSQFAEKFREADTNGDGVISNDEARAAGLWFTEDFNGVDTDRSGTVTLFEFVQAMQRRLSQWLSGFDAADTNRDGVVTEEEARRMPSMAEIFTTTGHDKGRTMSRAEYESYALDRLYRHSELPSVAPNIIQKRF